MKNTRGPVRAVILAMAPRAGALMHLAVLVTNTDENVFVQAHPKDGEKFSAMLGQVRRDWSFTVFSVKDGVFPGRPARFDGLILPGSPASVHDPAPWVARLLGLIREADAHGVAMFGACFGHQAIALALGGEVSRNPDGWVHGLTRSRLLT
jgi:GMP synthase-like glutamine amidotransferase